MIGGTIESHVAPYLDAMNLRTYRQQVLASNIANADTPYYKARDFDFKAAYAAARKQVAEDDPRLERTHARHLAPLNQATQDVPLRRTHAQHIAAADKGGNIPLLYRTEHQSAVDGNTVDMDVERGHIADNSLQYQVLAQILSHRFTGLRSAIAGNQG